METNKMNKNRAAAIAYSLATSTLVLPAIVEMTWNTYKMGKEFAPNLEEYVGSIGVKMIEYGLPAVCLASQALAGVIAICGTYVFIRDS